MFLLIWASLLLSARGDNKEAAAAPRILNSSRCDAQSEVVTCVCVSRGFPLPTVTWQLLGNVDVHSVVCVPSNRTVNSTVVLAAGDHRDVALKCVGHNDHGQGERNLTIPTNETKQEDLLNKLLITVQQPQVITAFAIGILLSATVCCLTRTCHRKKHRRSLNVADDMDMVTMVNVGEAEAADGDQAPREVEYSNIVFSVPAKSLAESKDAQEATETEYAEIKNEVAEERRCDGEVLGDDATEEGEGGGEGDGTECVDGGGSCESGT